MTASIPGVQPPKYQEVFDTIKSDILSGRYQPGQKLPRQARKNAVLWDNLMPDPETKDEQTRQLCRQYIAKKVAGTTVSPARSGSTS
jgi:hypothetical protein